MEQSNKKYLVVGANSFLGRAIIQFLKATNDVTGVYHTQTDKLSKDIKNIPISSLKELKDEYEAVFIISAAIPDKNKPVNPELLYEVNAKLPERICQQFKSAKIIYASSVSVYPENNRIHTESSELNAGSEYGKSKIAGENIVTKHPSYGIIRISSMYGPDMNETTFLPRIIHSALKNRKIQLFGNGGRLQNYIHVSDVAEIFVKAAAGHSNNTYLAVGTRSFSNLEIASLIKKEQNINVELTGEDHSSSFEYDGTFTYRSLGFVPQKNLREGISELIQWQQKKS